MVADWIKWQNDLEDDPRVEGVACQLKVKLPMQARVTLALGACARLWAYFDRQSVDGFVAHLTAENIDARAGFVGFAAALENVGWLIIEDGGLRIPRHDKHNGKTAKRRANEAIRSANRRGGGEGSATVAGLAAVAERSPSGRAPVESATSESEEESLTRARTREQDQDVDQGDIPLPIDPLAPGSARPTSRPKTFVLNDVRRERIKIKGVPADEVDLCWGKFIAKCDATGATFLVWDRAMDGFALSWATFSRKRREKTGSRADPNPHAGMKYDYACGECGERHLGVYGGDLACPKRGAA